jgi:hypothetical protein
VKHSGTASLRMEQFNEGNPHGLCRVVKKLTLEPWHQYDLSLWIKTQTVARPSTIRVALLTDMPDGPRHNLGRQSLGVRSTQDWRRHDVVFNTFAHRDVWLYLGAWDAREGRIWIDDVSLREVAGVNLLRREGCPVRVTSADGGQEYVEGQDFQRWEYPEMGRVPYGGVYQPVHPEPPLVLTPNSRIHEGQALKVSFYHTMRILDGQVCCCLRSDELFEHLEAHVRRVHELLHSPKTYFMSYDEIRLAGWCALCDTPHTTTGEILAENVRRCTEIIRRVAPDAEIVVWSDMFDPYHNAVDRYWHTRGTMKGSWNGLDPSLIIGNWNFGNRDASLAFFADRGHRQMIAAYYDRPQWQRSLGKWLQSADNVPGIEGVIYTTWMRDYRNLEAFADFVHGSSRRDTDRRDSPPKRN